MNDPEDLREIVREYQTLNGRWMMDLNRPDVEAALASASQLRELARQREDPEIERQEHLALGGARLCHGDLAAARGHLEKARAVEVDDSAVASGWLLTDASWPAPG